MNLWAITYILTVFVQFVYASPPQPGTKVCSVDVPGLCSQDFHVLNSTFGIIIPPQSHKPSPLFEDDIIYKMVQALPYGSAGMVSTQSNGSLHFVSAMWYGRRTLGISTPGASLISSTIYGQLMINNTSPQAPSAFALQPSPADQPLPCSIHVSPFYMYTKTQITAYARLQGCQIIKTATPTTINFFRTDAAPIYTDSSNQSAIFPLDNTMKTGSVLVENIDAIRTSTESYNAALSALQLEY